MEEKDVNDNYLGGMENIYIKCIFGFWWNSVSYKHIEFMYFLCLFKGQNVILQTIILNYISTWALSIISSMGLCTQ